MEGKFLCEIDSLPCNQYGRNRYYTIENKHVSVFNGHACGSIYEFLFNVSWKYESLRSLLLSLLARSESSSSGPFGCMFQLPLYGKARQWNVELHTVVGKNSLRFVPVEYKLTGFEVRLKFHLIF